MSKVILDLCGGTGSWSEPYKQAGYEVVVIDPVADGSDVRLMKYPGKNIHGVLAAPPCTKFSYARNRYPPTDEELLEGLSVVDACMRIAHVCKPNWWALENPVNKLRWFLGPPAWAFYQWEYGDSGHKPTGLWGNFRPPMKMVGRRTKESTWKTSKPNAVSEDAVTPPNFAKAFFEANP
jgi:hypothetical protein